MWRKDRMNLKLKTFALYSAPRSWATGGGMGMGWPKAMTVMVAANTLMNSVRPKGGAKLPRF